MTSKLERVQARGLRQVVAKAGRRGIALGCALVLAGCATNACRGEWAGPGPRAQEPPPGPPGPPPHAMPHDPAFAEALQACAQELGLPPPPGHGEGERPQAAADAGQQDHGTRQDRTGPEQRQKMDACLAGKGFEKPAGPPPGHPRRPPHGMPHDPAFAEALQACAQELGLPPPPGHDGGERPQAAADASGQGARPRQDGPDPEQRQKMDACLAGKGFEKPAGPPPAPPRQPPAE
ncbi:hypothetical protein [Stenotrophomonas sp. MMGLT7]|uniref:hypothetical protein n=1 Tax=Stenotrophomonas sp. MMGLT7 TaxID=2901227 RepID=UPI001E570A75|nr:hypothetical protein [Stenotrophomonas sp. MMGLT7]MCD7097736.1 hypothetical protein [Stenotrophomonas sp. MMGLT7]